MRKTKIVCTIGPASESVPVLSDLIAAGMNVARLNFSHGDYEEQGARIRTLHKLREELDVPLAVMLDTKGPEIRTGMLKGGAAVTLTEGQTFTLTTLETMGDETGVSVSFEGLPQDVHAGSTILLDDGLISLRVESVEGTQIICTVQNSGVLGQRKGVNLPGISLSMPAVTQKDIDDIEFGIKNGLEYVAASFVQRAADVMTIRRLIQSRNSGMQIIAKIENQQGVMHIDEIIKVADGIMVGRGDLGVEIPIENVPLVQKDIVHRCNRAGKPVIIATQMLDSMMRNPRPTRAEASDVANAIVDGTDAIMLSGETAAGKYPVEAVRTMARIAEHAETIAAERDIRGELFSSGEVNMADAVSVACCDIARMQNAGAIITATQSGITARLISKMRPQCPLIAVTTLEETRHRLALVWGVQTMMMDYMETTDEIIQTSVDVVQRAGILHNGDVAVITAGVPVGLSGTTNLIKVHVVGDVLMTGKGIGTRTAYGAVCIIHDAQEAEGRFMPGNVLVTTMTDNAMLPFMKKASAIIVEGDDILSHAAVVGLTLEIPVILGVEGAASRLKNGMFITADPGTGRIYNGRANV